MRYHLSIRAKEMKNPRITRTLKTKASQVLSAAAENEDHIVSGATMATSGGVLAASYASTMEAKQRPLPNFCLDT